MKAARRDDGLASRAGRGRMHGRALLAVPAALILAGSGCLASDYNPKLRPGDHYPSFTARDINGTQVGDGLLNGKVSVVGFLATQGSRYSRPPVNVTFAETWEVAQNLSGLPVQFLTVGDPGSGPTLDALRQEHGVRWPMVADDDRALDRAFGFHRSSYHDPVMVFGKDGRLEHVGEPGSWVSIAAHGLSQVDG